MAKRSPILGYNHNVRYRGLVFHVQTEDSGLLSPHLFTHLFHGGVIISTRKLVYDSGAAEDAIKSLMQAQHKAVLKDLRRGSFDDKIDVYLAGTPGLLPRGEGVDIRESEPSLATPPAGMPAVDELPTSRQTTDADVPAFELAPPGSPAAKVARTKTAERGSAPGSVRSNLPPPPPSAEELGGPTLNDHEAASVAAAVAAATSTIPNRMPTNDATIPVEMPLDMSPLEIELELDEPDEPRPADNAATVRNLPGDSVPPLPPPPHSQTRAPTDGARAAALPPRALTPGAKRPAITPPQVVSRPIAAREEDRSGAVEVYAPAPAGAELPPGASDSSRPGQYSQHKRASQKVPVIETYKDRSQPIPSGLNRPKPSSASPATPPSQSQSSGIPKPVGRDATPPSRQTGGSPVVPARASDSGSGTARSDSGATVSGMGRAGSGSNPGTARSDASGSRPGASASSTQPRISGSGSQPGTQPRPAGSGSQPGTQGTQPRISGAPGSQPNRTGSQPGTQRDTGSRPGTSPREPSGPSSARTSSSSSSSGVVMTRPAVIVGAPAKPNQPQRVRKAREEEGRGFGQGLISEKSLDEVILAYLSEDADEK